MSETSLSGKTLSGSASRPVRAREGAVVAGVCQALAIRLNLDPIVVRVMTVFAALCGGAGVVAYLLCWLMWPAREGEPAKLDVVLPALSRWAPRTRTILIAVASLVVAIPFSRVTPFNLVPLVVVFVAWFVAVRYQARERVAEAAAVASEAWASAWTPQEQAFYRAADAWQRRLDEVYGRAVRPASEGLAGQASGVVAPAASAPVSRRRAWWPLALGVLAIAAVVAAAIVTPLSWKLIKPILPVALIAAGIAALALSRAQSRRDRRSDSSRPYHDSERIRP